MLAHYFYHQQYTEVERVKILNSLRCAVIYSKMSAYIINYPYLTNQERIERVIYQKCSSIQSIYLNNFPRFS